MKRILGIDLGTSSIGWSIVDRDDKTAICELKDEGVLIFPEGVAYNKGSEKPSCQDRTLARGTRKLIYRRRSRKIELLKVLIKNRWCPYLSSEQLKNWKYRKVYPSDDDFFEWRRTDNAAEKNPYHDRFRALTEKLDLAKQEDRYCLGRALYHMVQRRGFLSSLDDERKSGGGDKPAKNDETGKVKQGISELSLEMEKAGCKYLGEYFYKIFGKEKIRCRYTARIEHYEAEFDAICQKQEIGEDLTKELRGAIFFQRPLKSQKGTVGHCTFEPGRRRCPVSHPLFEEFRMRCFINNIRIKTIYDRGTEPRPLYEEEVRTILPLFYKVSKRHTFEFSDIARALTHDRSKHFAKCSFGVIDPCKEYYLNFPADFPVPSCPVSAGLKKVFGEDYGQYFKTHYAKRLLKNGDEKSIEQITDEVWHALFYFERRDLLVKWAVDNLGLNEEAAKRFTKIEIKKAYSSLSKKAISKILPHLRKGIRYDCSVFLANLKEVLPANISSDASRLAEVEQCVINTINDFSENREQYRKLSKTINESSLIKDYLLTLNADGGTIDKKMYHPSDIDIYPQVRLNEFGILQLGSPRTPALRNPMAMRAMNQLRKLINYFLSARIIDRDTVITLELARELNDANTRKAIRIYNMKRQKENDEYAALIKELYREEGRDKNVLDFDISKNSIIYEQEEWSAMNSKALQNVVQKWRLWEEQKHICLYTGKVISIVDILDPNPRFDIEHTIPRSREGDNSLANKTLCDMEFNRTIKMAKIPSELDSDTYEQILERIETVGWRQKIDELKQAINRHSRKAKNATTKEEKDKAIQDRLVAKMELDYWNDKLRRFTMTKIPDNFARRQGVNIGVIGKYAKEYLKSVFPNVFIVKGETTAEFRKMWEIQGEYEKKDRSTHIHHAIDAITIACIGPEDYAAWAKYKTDEERFRLGMGARPSIPKPWPTFSDDIRRLSDNVLISYYNPDNMPKQAKKKLRIRGKIQKDKNGRTIYQRGDVARGVLHGDTFYGAIKRDDEIKYVIRKSISQLKKTDIDKIVDDTVREKVKAAIKEVGLEKAISPGYVIWMNRAKNIAIKKVHIYASSVTHPIKLKTHRDLSCMEYKQHYYVQNEENYCMAMYEGFKDGKLLREISMVDNLTAARYFKNRYGKIDKTDNFLVEKTKNGCNLKYLLRKGTMVLFYENSKDELRNCSIKDLSGRLYKLVSLSDGDFLFASHLKATTSSKYEGKGNSMWINGKQDQNVLRITSLKNLNFIVQGYDFDIDVMGKIKFKNQ